MVAHCEPAVQSRKELFQEVGGGTPLTSTSCRSKRPVDLDAAAVSEVSSLRMWRERHLWNMSWNLWRHRGERFVSLLRIRCFSRSIDGKRWETRQGQASSTFAVTFRSDSEVGVARVKKGTPAIRKFLANQSQQSADYLMVDWLLKNRFQPFSPVTRKKYWYWWTGILELLVRNECLLLKPNTKRCNNNDILITLRPNLLKICLVCKMQNSQNKNQN